MKRNRSRPRLKVTGGGASVVNHAGTWLLCDVAEAVGLSERLSDAMAATKRRRRGYYRGRVLVADGGEAISDLATHRNKPQPFREVASNPTAWRALEAVDDAALARIRAARARARAVARAGHSRSSAGGARRR